MLIAHLTSVADSTASLTSDDLLIRIAKGDPNALDTLYRNNARGLYAYILSVLKSQEDAQDALHDCFLAIVKGAPSYRAEGKAKSWMYTIAHNRCMQILRERRKQSDDSPEDWMTAIPVQEHATTEDRVVLTACMQQLSEEERRIVVLHAVSGFRHHEIARVLELPLSTVLSKYRRALKKLRTNLEKGD